MNGSNDFEKSYKTKHPAPDAQLLNQKITTTIPDQIFIIDLKDHSNMYSNRPAFLGYTLATIEDPFEFFQQLIHPDDFAKAFEHFFEKLFAAEDDEIIETEYRMYTRDGELIWFNERVKVFKRDEEGKVWQYINIIQDITERKEAELAKQESDILFQSLYEKNSLGVVIANVEGIVLSCNDCFCQIVGYEEEELAGKSIKEITYQDDREQEYHLISDAIRKGEDHMFMEKRYVHKNGKVVWVNLGMTFLYDEGGILRQVLAMIEDITEKRRIRLDLEEKEAFQKAILSTLPDLKFRISKDGYYLDYYPAPDDNKELLALPEEFLGKTLGEVLPAYIAEAALKNTHLAIKTGKVTAFEYSLPIGGILNHYEVRISAINEEEAIAVVRNVSERVWAQQELKNKIKELDNKNKELKNYIDSNMQLENFAYIASHDLREPLRTMGTFAQFLKKEYKDQLDETAHTYINSLVKGANDLNELIEDLLTYSSIDSQATHPEVIALPELLEEVIGGLKKTIEESQADIVLNNLPEQLTGHPNRLKQLFQNLLINAIKFKKPDVPPKVSVDCTDLGSLWKFVVRDNGIGVDPEFHETIFLLFKKLHGRKDFQGTGLGLAICKKVVEQMGGEIWVESAPDQGASFYFTLRKPI